METAAAERTDIKVDLAAIPPHVKDRIAKTVLDCVREHIRKTDLQNKSE